MKTVKQLIRQPMKTLAGILLMAMAAAIVCVSVGQALAAEVTKQTLDEEFTTVAIPSDQEDLELPERFLMEQEVLDWLTELAQTDPETVKQVSQCGTLSAAIAELLPYNKLANPVGALIGTSGSSTISSLVSKNNYDSAMMVITLEQVGEVMEPNIMPFEKIEQPERADYATQEEYELAYIPYVKNRAMIRDYEDIKSKAQGYTVELVGTVQQVVSLQEGLRSPEGMTARITLVMPSEEQIEMMELEVGQQYIVYGMDYYDDYRYLVSYMKSFYDHVEFEPFDPSLLKEATQLQQKNYAFNQKKYVEYLYDSVPLDPAEYRWLNSVSMTVCMPSNLFHYQPQYDENGALTQWLPKTQTSYTDSDGNTVTVDMALYDALYAVPTIARLDGSLEDFLASEDGAAWQAAIECDQINNHAFTVVGVDGVKYLPAFALENCKMGQGRDFTQEELASGARVCIIHEYIAEMAGVELGDTITLQLYTTEHGQPYCDTWTEGDGLLCPAASLYISQEHMVETAEYTVVGFWQGSATVDVSKNYYSFDCNTVFVPQGSVQGQMEYRNSVPFVSVILENGTIDDFHMLVRRAGYAGRFKYSDQDYSTVAENFHNYSEMSSQIQAIGGVLYAVLLLLFLLLYPGSQRKNVWMMQSMGCGFLRRFAAVVLSAMAMVIPGAVLGGMAGAAVWSRVVDALQVSAESAVTLQLPQGALERIALAQLVLCLALSVAAALIVARPRKMSPRR